MPNDDRASRRQLLWDLSFRRALTSAEQVELDTLLAEADAAETAQHAAASARMSANAADLDARIESAEQTAAELEQVLSAQRELIADAHAYLARLRARREALAEAARVALLRTGTDR